MIKYEYEAWFFDLHVFCYVIIYMRRTKIGAVCFDLAVLISFQAMLSTSTRLKRIVHSYLRQNVIISRRRSVGLARYHR